MAVTITSSSSLPDATAGSPYTFTFTASGSVSGQYEWAVDGDAPPGLVLNPTTGQISISNPIEGTWNFGASVKDPVSPEDFDYRKVQLIVDPAAPIPPTVRITQAEEGATISGTASIIQAQVQAFNAVITEVEFFIDGVTFDTRTAYPWQTTLDTTALTNGAHELTAVARDSNAEETTSTVRNVTVNNDLAAVPPKANFTINPDPVSGLVPNDCYFNNTSTNYVAQDWFIDGVWQTSTDDMAHFFTESGAYVIKLRVANVVGVVDEIEKTFYALVPAGQASTNGLMDEVIMNPHYSAFATGGPEWATAIERSGAGGATSQRNVNRQDFIARYELDYDELRADEARDFRTFQILRRGRARFFRMVPPDCPPLVGEAVARYNASTGDLEYVSATNGTDTKFFLIKNYSDPANSYNRQICKPNPLKPFSVGIADAAAPGVLLATTTFQGGYYYNPFAILPESRTQALAWFGNVTIDYFVGRLKFAVAPPANHVLYVWGEYHLPVAFVSDWHKAKVDFTTTTQLSVVVEEALPAEIGCSPTEAFNKA